MRFCMITTCFPPYNFGGDGLFVYRLSNELARRGHTVHVIHCTDTYRSLSGKIQTEPYPTHPNVSVHGLHSRFGTLSPLLTRQTGRPLLKSGEISRILSQGFDVIHFHNPSLVGGPAVLTMGAAVKLYTMHEYWLVCPTHMLLKYDREPCVERACLTCTLAHRRPPQWWRYSDLLTRSLTHVDAFIAPSRFIKEVHERELAIPVVHIPNFVPDTEADGGAVEPLPAAPPYFLFVGRLERLKGDQTLIPLFRRYHKAQLWIAGSGSVGGGKACRRVA